MEKNIKKSVESAKQHVELNSWKARVRIVGCGNFEDPSAHTKEEYASCNIRCEGLRLMFSARANNPAWRINLWYRFRISVCEALQGKGHRGATGTSPDILRVGSSWFLREPYGF